MDRSADNRELAKRRVSVDRQVTAVRLGLLEDVLITIRHSHARGGLVLDLATTSGDGMHRGTQTDVYPCEVAEFAEALLEMVQQ